MQEIILNDEHKAIIDDEDFEFLSQFTWYPQVHKRAGKVYAQNELGIGMHRLIMDAPDGLLVDHRNGNGLDNQKENLRIVDHVGNVANSKVNKDNVSGYKGVTYYPLNEKWGAVVVHKGKRHWQGLHNSPLIAALAYNVGALRIIGECAWLNKIEEGVEIVPKQVLAKSGYKGVSYFAGNKKWGAKFMYKGRKYWFGLHDTPEEAAMAYNEGAIRIIGPTAWLNQVEPLTNNAAPTP